MIQFNRLTIKDETSFDKLKEIINPLYIDDDTIGLLKNNLSHCKFIIIEYPYYDSDYLSSYYSYYCKKYRNFPKECYRLLFFENKNTLIGYITLRPTCDRTHLGRMYFEPQYILKGKDTFIITSNNKVHIAGEETMLNIFPQMGQDTDFCVCAHVSAWAILRHYSNKFKRYPEITMGGLSEKIEWDSKVPLSSHGLLPKQIADVFHKFGYSPLSIFEEIDGHDLFLEKLYAYLESGIPLVGGMVHKEHAIAIIGYEKCGINIEGIDNSFFENYYDFEKSINRKTNFVMSARYLSNLIVNDDNYFPYKKIKQIPLNNEGYSINDINYFIVPLYDRVTLLYEEVKQSFFEYASREENWNNNKYVVRIFLTSANTYKEYIAENMVSNEAVFNILIQMNMPKLIWCIELATFETFKEQKVDYILLLDSTSSKFANDKFLFVSGEKYVLYRDNKVERELIDKVNSLKLPRFSKNFKEIKNGTNKE